MTWIKDLNIILDRKLSDIFMIETNLLSVAMNLTNWIPIVPFYDYKFDDELTKLTGLLCFISNTMGNMDCTQIIRKYFNTYKLYDFD